MPSEPNRERVESRLIEPAFHEEWDAGEMSCGELLLELKLRLRRLSPFEVIKLTTRDPGARADVPAWCRLTGHRLVVGLHPIYFIERRENRSNGG